MAAVNFLPSATGHSREDKMDSTSPTHLEVHESAAAAHPLPTFDTIQHVMRFARAARHRRRYVFAALIVAGLLGAVYYLTATRIYQASAELLVTTTGADVLANSDVSVGAPDAHMPTYEHLFESAVVLEGALQRIAQMPPQMRIDFVGEPREKWQQVLADNLSAKGAHRTEIIEIKYRSKSPEAAAAVVQALVDSYLEFMEKHHRDVSIEILTILDKEHGEIETQLATKQHELLDLKHEMGDLGLRDDSQFVHPAVQRVMELNKLIVEIQKQRMQIEASLAAVNTAAREGRDLRQHLVALDPVLGRSLMMNAMGLDPQAAHTINLVERKLIDDRARLETLSAQYGPRHPEIVELNRRISEGQAYVAAYRQRVNNRMQSLQGPQLGTMLADMLSQRLAEVQAHEQRLLEEYHASEQAAVALNDRMAAVQVAENELARLRSLEETLLDRISNVDINQNQAQTRVAVVTPPEVPTAPVSPRLLMVIGVCLGGGLGVGMLAVYLLDLLDDRFRSPEELHEQLAAPVLAIVRRFDANDAVGVGALQLHVNPEAVESEAFRTLRAALAFSGEDMERLAITSSEPGDGKTTVLSNLGVAYAQAGKRTLLIDADLRKPGLTKMMDLRSVEGLSTLLRSDEDLDRLAPQLICSPGIENLHVLPSGPRPSDPSELLSSARMQQFVAWCEQHYDQVFIDCPPILAASDAALVGRLLDGIMLVVQPEKNHRRAVLRAAEGLRAMRVNLVGIVANRIGEEAESGYYGYGYGYGYGQGYGRDEEEDEHDHALPEAPRIAEHLELQPRRAA